jgi:hypothetical protein
MPERGTEGGGDEREEGKEERERKKEKGMSRVGRCSLT